MAYTTARPDFRVVVDAAFVTHGVWLVHGAVEYRGDRARDRRTIEEARTELMLGIVRESDRGRRGGAQHVQFLVEGDPELACVLRVAPAWCEYVEDRKGRGS